MSLQEFLHYCKVFKYKNQVSLPRTLCTSPQTYTYYDTTFGDTKTLLSRKQTFKVSKVATQQSG